MGHNTYRHCFWVDRWKGDCYLFRMYLLLPNYMVVTSWAIDLLYILIKNSLSSFCVHLSPSLDRYLEGCNVPITMKRRCHSSDNTMSSDEDKQKGGDNPMQLSEGTFYHCS